MVLCASTLECHVADTGHLTPSENTYTGSMCRCDYPLIGRLRFHYDRDSDEYENEFLCADIIVSCVLPGFIFVIVVVDDEMEAMSLSSICVQKRNEDDSDMSVSFSYRTRCRREILTSLMWNVAPTP